MRINNVPNGWTKKRLSKIALLQRGRFSIRPRNDPSCYGGDVPFVQTGDVSKAGIYLKHFSQTLNEKGVAVSKVFPANTILITIAANIGDTAITTFPVACPDSLIAINSEHYNFMWLNYVLQTQKNKLNALATQNAQKNINLETLNNLKLLVPPIGEQKKIAEILGTWDRAIEELTNLIAEKKELKRGLMQRLLTGSQRLPGFSKTWKKIKCADVLFERKTYLPKGKELEHVSLTKEGVVPKTARYERDFLVRAEEKEYKITKFNDICYNPANLKFGVICRNTYGDGIFSPIYVTFEIKNIDSVFLGFIVKTHMFQGRALRYEQGTVYERMAVSAEDLLKMKLEVPADSAEQKAIADVLSKADSEIDLLNQRLDVLKEQKLGLMQKLLTGEIRVKVDME